jgi:hypothetical protein
MCQGVYRLLAMCRIPFDGHADFFSAVGHRLHNTGGHPTNLKVLLGGQPPGRPKLNRGGLPRR